MNFRKTLLIGITILWCQSFFAFARQEVPPALPRSLAAKFDSLYVMYNGRVAPFETMARDYSLRIYGKTSLHGYNATQIATAVLFFYDWWRDEPLKGKDSQSYDALMELSSGSPLRIFPLNFPDSLRAMNPGLPERLWLGCDDALPVGLDYPQWVFVRRTLDLVSDQVRAGDFDAAEQTLSKIAKWQRETAGEDIPSEATVRAERLYDRIGRPAVPFMASLTFGLLLFVLSCVLISRGRDYPKWLRICAWAFCLVIFLYLSLVIGLRTQVGGRGPFDGGYAVMMLIAWFASLWALCLGPRSSLNYPLALLVAGFTMLEAYIGGSSYLINPLLPALQSPFLAVHVMSMMLSYTLLGMVCLCGIMGLAVRGRSAKERISSFGIKVLVPAECLLIAGTLLGAFWAKQAWGSFWSWDPKETWALITAIVYAALIALRCTVLKKNTTVFNILCIVAFVSVLLTYFGVNLLFGGMHSYV